MSQNKPLLNIFNRAQAISDGFSEEEITNYLAEKRKQGINLIDDPKQVQNILSQQQQSQQPVAETKKERSLLAKILPILGGVGGAVVGGSVGSLPGAIAGGAAGSGLGETLAEGISGEKLNPQKILTETTKTIAFDAEGAARTSTCNTGKPTITIIIAGRKTLQKYLRAMLTGVRLE